MSPCPKLIPCLCSLNCRIVLLGILLAYIADAVIRVRDYTANNTGTAMTPWPSWGWICAIVAAGLWLVVGALASCEIPCYICPAPPQVAIVLRSNLSMFC